MSTRSPPTVCRACAGPRPGSRVDTVRAQPALLRDRERGPGFEVRRVVAVGHSGIGSGGLVSRSVGWWRWGVRARQRSGGQSGREHPTGIGVSAPGDRRRAVYEVIVSVLSVSVSGRPVRATSTPTWRRAPRARP
jgi:hypothetical protein